MKKINIYKQFILVLGLIVIGSGCEKGLTDEATYATFPQVGEIFKDTPLGLGSNFYFPYSGSKATAWSVDDEVSYEGTSSMRFDVPNASDPAGNYAGGIFKIDGGYRDLSQFDALTFWIKATTGTTINEIGFGEDFGENKFQVTRYNVPVSTNWNKVVIPIPDPSKLDQINGLFRYATGGIGEQGSEVGYTFWIDDLKFEKLGTVANGQPKIMNGNEVTTNTFNGTSAQVTGTQTMNVAGQNITVGVAPSYFTFMSSNRDVAIVNELGKVSVQGAGASTITATLGGVKAKGSLTINSIGNFTFPDNPTLPAANVISVFSNAYTNVPVDYFNGYWGGSTTQTSDISVNGNDLKQYTNLNYVGIEFQNPTIDASAMTTLHLDLFSQESGSLTIRLRDRGNNGKIESDNNGNPIGDDADLTYTVNMQGNQWNGVEIPLNGGLANQKNNMSQIVFVGGVSSFIVDNIYFHN